jgi:hypothetical protein
VFLSLLAVWMAVTIPCSQIIDKEVSQRCGAEMKSISTCLDPSSLEIGMQCVVGLSTLFFIFAIVHIWRTKKEKVSA